MKTSKEVLFTRRWGGGPCTPGPQSLTWIPVLRFLSLGTPPFNLHSFLGGLGPSSPLLPPLYPEVLSLNLTYSFSLEEYWGEGGGWRGGLPWTLAQSAQKILPGKAGIPSASLLSRSRRRHSIPSTQHTHTSQTHIHTHLKEQNEISSPKPVR